MALGRVLGFLLLEFLATLLFGCVRMRLLWDLLQLLDRVLGLWRHILVVEVLLHRGATARLVLRVRREDLGIPEDSGRVNRLGFYLAIHSLPLPARI